MQPMQPMQPLGTSFTKVRYLIPSTDYLNGSPLFVYPFHVPGMGQYGIPTTSIYDTYITAMPQPVPQQGKFVIFRKFLRNFYLMQA